MKKLDARACLEEEILAVCLQNDIKKYRAEQVFRWLHQKAVHDWEEMKNIGQQDRKKLSDVLFVQPLEIVNEQRSQDGTVKFLFRLGDGESIETVLMNYENDATRDRHTICVSTQVGCAIGCSFCATGLDGFKRNLSAGEITGQVLEIVRLIQQKDPNFSVTNIVFMGMGEPFLNYKAVMKAITLLNSKKGQNIGMRRMTISTSGVAPKIIQLAEDNSQVGLAISLHSARNSMRDNLVPINKKYPLEKLIEACRVYSSKTSRRITFEMALQNANTNKEEAQALIKLLRGMLVHVNLIPINPVSGSIQRPAKEKIMMFKNILEEARVPVSIREEKGLDIEAACGQLRQRLECERYESVNPS